MKNFMKLTIAIFVFTITAESYAQTYGIKAGPNLSTALAKDDDETYSDDFTMNPGFHIGATVDFPLSRIFSFETGLLVSTKGFKVDYEETLFGETIKFESKSNPIYIDVPMIAKAYFNVGNARMYGAFGPYIAFGVGGKYKSETTAMGETETDEGKINWGTDAEEGDTKRLDYGLSVGTGVEIKAIQIGLSYGLGLANISADTDNGFKLKNRVIGITFGYKLGG